MHELIFTREDDKCLAIGRIDITIADPGPTLPAAEPLITFKEAEKMKLQELEHCLSSLSQIIEKQAHRLEDQKSKLDIILARLEVQEEKTAMLAQDFQEWQLAHDLIQERV